MNDKYSGYVIIGIPNNKNDGVYAPDVNRTIKDILGLNKQSNQIGNMELYEVWTVQSGDYRLYVPKPDDDSVDMILEVASERARQLLTRDFLKEKLAAADFSKMHKLGPIDVYGIDNAQLNHVVCDIPFEYSITQLL